MLDEYLQEDLQVVQLVPPQLRLELVAGVGRLATIQISVFTGYRSAVLVVKRGT